MTGEAQSALEGNDPLSLLLDSSMRDVLIKAIDDLPEREKTVMGLYYEQDMNLREIGEVLGVSESRVCQQLIVSGNHSVSLHDSIDWCTLCAPALLAHSLC